MILGDGQGGQVWPGAGSYQTALQDGVCVCVCVIEECCRNTSLDSSLLLSSVFTSLTI